jgi:hypothetical protein
MTTTAPAIARVRTFRLRQLAVPTEHGSWSFLFEPTVAALAIAFSVGGLWVALMTLGAFLCRQPLKILIADRIGMKDRGRAQAASAFLLLYRSILAIGFVGTILVSGWLPLMPYAVVLPLIAFQIFSDVLRKGRQLLPEVSGAVTISASAAAIALAGSQSWAIAATLWVIFVSRAVPSILYVRNRLLLEKGKNHSTAIPNAAHIAALIVVCVLSYYGLSPALTIFAMLMLLWRAVAGLAPGRKKLKTMQIGVREIVYGALTVLSVVVGYYAGF